MATILESLSILVTQIEDTEGITDKDKNRVLEVLNAMILTHWQRKAEGWQKVSMGTDHPQSVLNTLS